MSERAFFGDQARSQAAEAVKSVESLTSAELVVALRRASGSYRHSDYLFGAALSLATAIAILLLPKGFHPAAIPVDLAMAFALGAAACARWPALRRVLASRRSMGEQVRVAARAAFYDLGVSRTTGRTGVLVYVSMLERTVEVVPDVGVDLAAMGSAWTTAAERIADAVRRTDLDGFLAAVRELGPALAEAHPRRTDDVNELADEVSAS